EARPPEARAATAKDPGVSVAEAVVRLRAMRERLAARTGREVLAALAREVIELIESVAATLSGNEAWPGLTRACGLVRAALAGGVAPGGGPGGGPPGVALAGAGHALGEAIVRRERLSAGTVREASFWRLRPP